MKLITDFLGKKVSRMIIGDNPVTGHSYVPDLYSGANMKNYYTADLAVKALHEAEAAGINTCLPLANDFILRVLRQFKNEGGKMNIIFQPYPAIDLKINLPMMLELEPFGIYHQGSRTDFLCETGQEQVVRDNIKMIKDSGVKTGMASHEPELILRAEEEDWGLDFYMTSLYNGRTRRKGEDSGFITGKSKRLLFNLDDRLTMYKVIKSVSKPCIAFKPFAGGQVFYEKKPDEIPHVVYETLKEVYNNIKENDIVCMGVFQKHKDQIKENMAAVERIMRDGQ